nr:Sua5/YciO/YrdC/YwlC family protein [Gammaproteobacteria bacterium]
MAEFLQLHRHNLDARVIKKAVQVLLKGGVIVYPTDSTYALGCHIGDKSALERI